MLARYFLAAVAAAATALAVPSSSLASSSTNSHSRAAASPPPPVVDLGYTRVQGYYNETADQYRWKGIRYATAERFQAPRTPAAHLPDTEVVQADTYGNICWQSSMGGLDLSAIAVGTQSEDCLFLNVIGPASAHKGSGLPVLVCIHGGGYAFGSATAGGRALSEVIVDLGDKMVIVTLQYRLGAFGFLAGREVAENGALNAGLLDQQFAFRWVQQHISKFGGNPDEVTLDEAYAGTSSVLHHLVANGGNTQTVLGLKRPLFRDAIGGSPGAVAQPSFDSSAAEATYTALARAVGCAEPKNASFACLQHVESADLAAAALKLSLSRQIAEWTFVPVVEGGNGLLRERSSVALARGIDNLHRVAVAVDDQHDDDQGFSVPHPLFHDETLESEQLTGGQIDHHLSWLFPILTDVQQQAAIAAYQSMPRRMAQIEDFKA